MLAHFRIGETESMPRKPEPLEPWMHEAIQIMVCQNLSLRQAAIQLGEEITPQQADNVCGRARFQDALREARLAHYSEIGSNPHLNQNVVIGMLYQMAERLASDREDYKAADALLKLAKVKGIVGNGTDSLVKLFGSLSQADITEMKERLRAQTQSQHRASISDTPTEPKIPN
jgi:hypothetical protein